MFSRGKKATAGTALVPLAQPRGKPPAGRGPSIIAGDLHIIGNVSTDGELHIDGRIDGDVVSRMVTVGESGYVDGRIDTHEILVHGLVRGSIRARTVRLMQGCKVIADIAHDILSIDQGASFEGQCRRTVAPEEDELSLHERVD